MRGCWWGYFFMGLDYGRALPLETKQLDGDEWAVEGYLSTFGNRDSGDDIVLPGAFDATLASGRKVKFLFGHDDTKIAGPPLTLRVDDHGLFARGRISKTALGGDIHTWLLDGALDSWSIGYVPTDVGFKEAPEGGMVRLLKAVDLLEGSLVAIPMNEAATVTGVKAADLDGKPFPNEHACRLKDPGAFQPDSFRRTTRDHNGKTYSVIMGRLKGDDTMTEQAFRYPKDTWTADAARSHCSSHDGARFEPASDGKAAGCGCARGDGLDYETHAHQLVEGVEEFLDRTRHGADRRVKEGRAISAARRNRMAEVSGSLRQAADDIDALLTETAPPEKTLAYSPALALGLRRARLRRHGVVLEVSP